jgi:hypothetical protein
MAVGSFDLREDAGALTQKRPAGAFLIRELALFMDAKLDVAKVPAK